MTEKEKLLWDVTAQKVCSGEIAVIPTDTVYGIVASANDPSAVERLYRVRGRDTKKPCIILLPTLEAIQEYISRENFHRYESVFRAIWPSAVSVSIPVPEKKWEYLHRGKKSLAFRIPDNKTLREFLKTTGPIIAPSANPEGRNPAETIEDAKQYFGNNVSLYVDGGRCIGKPSTLISLSKNAILVLREGSVSIDAISRSIPRHFHFSC